MGDNVAATMSATAGAATGAVLNNYGLANPMSVDLTTADPRDVICYVTQSTDEYNGDLGARISAIFVIGIVSTFFTFFPVVARRVPKFHIPLYVYLFARYFGSGVIVATAFIHLLDPAYGEIGPQTCVGMTGGWAEYSWPPAIALTSCMFIFLMDFAAERYVENKYGIDGEVSNIQDTVTGRAHREDQDDDELRRVDTATRRKARSNFNSGEDVNKTADAAGKERRSSAMIEAEAEKNYERKFAEDAFLSDDLDEKDEQARQFAVQQQLAAFLILEFGVIFHSVIIGLNLGVAGDEFSTLYVVLVFHQSFEGLGIGARLSTIPFRKGSWVPWLLCSAYGITTPISIAIGLGVRTTYNSGSFTANVVSGVLDSISAGILIYTGLVELLARDFIFNPLRTKDNKILTFMTVSVLLGAGIMALLGKWA